MHRGRGAQARVVWTDEAATDAGVRRGQSLARARAGCAGLVSRPWDEVALARAQADAVARLLPLTPRVAVDGPYRLWAEPAPLGDTAPWCEAVADALAPLGGVRLGIGPWAAVAYAAARAATGPARIVGDDEAPAVLDRAPLADLELEPDALVDLRAVGVRHGGQLRALDPVEVGVRFGPGVARVRRRLDGDDPRGPATPRLREEGAVTIDLEHPIERVDALLFLLRPALDQVLRPLRGRGEGATGLGLSLRDARGRERKVEVRVADPVTDPRTALELVRTRLESVGGDEAPSAVHALHLVVLERGPAGGRNGTLDRAASRDPSAGSVALLRLRQRFAATVQRAEPRAHADPFRRAGWAADAPSGHGVALPWRLLEPPGALDDAGRLALEGRPRQVRRLSGVERAFGPWWRTGAFRVERLVWAEVEGPRLVLLRARREGRGTSWEAIAWVD
ncbi:MAG: DNA polymerase Y family protein [Sandaracinaceae bacterium]